MAVVVTDVIVLVTLSAILLGLTFLGWIGSALHPIPVRMLFCLLGLGHALLQLATPLWLTLCLPWTFALAWGTATVAFTWLVGQFAHRLLLRDRAAARDRSRFGLALLLLWAGWSGLLLNLASRWQPRPAVNGLTLVANLLLGALFSCTWLGWYLAVALAFDGHNNEAGGSARIERFKQIIRFRLTAEGLTGFVIAVDDPQDRYEHLRPRLIDVFEVRPR